MASMSEITQLCRLCLIKDEVNVPIFQDVNVIDQIFLKISACLPIKVSKEDKLPKKICDACSYKLELFYDFLNTSKASEKQLRKWIDQLGAEKESSKGINPTTIILKQEIQDPAVDLSQDELSISTAAHNYSIQQQQLSYGETVEFELPQEGFININEASTVISSSRKRPAESEHGLSDDSEYDDDVGLVGSKITKMEDDEDSEIDADQTAFIDLPSGSGENDQAGPSGVGKETADAPGTFLTYGQLAVFTKVDDYIETLYSENQENESNVDENSCDSFYEGWEAFDELELEKFMEEDSLKKILKPNRDNKNKSTVKKKFSLCSICGKYVHTIEKHMKIYHGSFKCETCLQTFKTEDDLEAHKELHGNNEYPCKECTLSFKRPLDYAYHSKEHCALKTYSCPLCQFKTPSRGSVKIHIQHHEKDYKYTCEICNRGFISNSVYTEHVEGHAGIKKFQCDICFKKFLYKRYLMVHRKLNHKKILEGIEDINECHICRRKFSFEKSLIRHLSKIHGIGKDVSVDCSVCHKRIANPYNLKMHMRTHTGEKPYVCETCGKAFTKRVNLRRHLHNLHE